MPTRTKEKTHTEPAVPPKPYTVSYQLAPHKLRTHHPHHHAVNAKESRGALGLEHDVGTPLGAGAAAGGVVLIQLTVADGQGRMLVTVVDQHLHWSCKEKGKERNILQNI